MSPLYIGLSRFHLLPAPKQSMIPRLFLVILREKNKTTNLSKETTTIKIPP